MRTTADYTELLVEVKERAAALGLTRLMWTKADVARVLGVPAQHLHRHMAFPRGEKYVTPQWVARQLHREDARC